MTARSRSPVRRQPGSLAMAADRSDPLFFPPDVGIGVSTAILSLPNLEVRVTQDTILGQSPTQPRIHRVDIRYGWSGSSWLGSMSVTVEPGRDVVICFAG
jgi:hypothetical protein